MPPAGFELHDLEGTAGRADLDPTVGWGRALEPTVEAPLPPGPTDASSQSGSDRKQPPVNVHRWDPPTGRPWPTRGNDGKTAASATAPGRTPDLGGIPARAEPEPTATTGAHGPAPSVHPDRKVATAPAATEHGAAENPADPADPAEPPDDAEPVAGQTGPVDLPAVAGMQERVLAGAVDYGVPLLGTALALWVGTGLGGLAGLVAVAFITYNTVEQGLTGRTTGKRLTHTRLVGDLDGEPIGPGRVCLRLMVHLADLVALAGVVPMATDNRQRTLGDRAVGSIVVPDHGRNH